MRLTKNDSAHSFWNCGKKRDIHRNSLQKKLFVSDKAVSKWERGLSLPDITLLGPLAEILGVTVTELLQAQRISEEKNTDKAGGRCSRFRFPSFIGGGTGRKKVKTEKEYDSLPAVYGSCRGGNMAFAICRGWERDIFTGFFTIEGLSFLFGAWFLLFARETLPAFYDENKINYYSQGPFRIHIAGVYFNNRTGPMSCELDG